MGAELFKRKPPKVTYLSDGYYLDNCSQDEEDAGIAVDQTDRLPRELFVRDFDIICFGIAMITYTFDVLSDITVAVMHWNEGRIWSCLFVILLTLICSLVLNIVSYAWILDDVMKSENGEKPKFKCTSVLWLKTIACILQGGPLIYYLTALSSAIKFRRENEEKEKRRHFCRMIEAERDATLLRFFEAFLESAPQLLLQGVLLAQFMWTKPEDAEYPKWVFIQLASISLSLLSVCWSISTQHRSLRMARPDKVNMHPHESFLQFIWRFSTVFSRYIVLILLILNFKFFAILFFIVHFLLSLTHVAALQSINTPSTAIEVGLLVINACIHGFTPFNMVDGKTRWRFMIAYTIEAFEGMAIICICCLSNSFDFPYKWEMSLVSIISFVFGLTVMSFYYSCCHPNRRKHIRLGIEEEEPKESEEATKTDEIQQLPDVVVEKQ